MSENEKLTNYFNEIQNTKEFEQNILNKYINEFEEKFSNILILSESEFMINFRKRMISILQNEYSEEAFEDDIINYDIKIAEKKIYENFFRPIKNLLLKAFFDYESMLKSTRNKIPSDIFITTNFKRHCLNSDNFAFHSCNSKFIPVYTNYINDSELIKGDLLNKIPNDGLKIIADKKFNSLTFVICIGCKKSYFSKEIQMFCQPCNKNYSTSIIRKEEINLQPATWETYHCNALINDTMKCIKCKATFYVNIDKNCLECIECNFKCDPMSIFWTCHLCLDEFTSNAKIYNPLEFKLVKQAINDAIIEKKIIKPLEISCCKLDLSKTLFYHKLECNGSLYKGMYDNQTIVVCEKCKAMNFYYHFVWTCPKCYRKFNQKQILQKKVSDDNFKIEEANKNFQSRKTVMNDFRKKSSNKISDSEFNRENLKKNEIVKKKTQFSSLSTSAKEFKDEEITPSKSALKFTPYENSKGTKFTKILNKKVNIQEGDNEEINIYVNNILTTVLTIDTDRPDNKEEDAKVSRNKIVNLKLKNAKTIDHNDYDTNIKRPKDLSPVQIKEDRNLSDNEHVYKKKNMQLLNPFKQQKMQSEAIERFKNKKVFEDTKRKTKIEKIIFKSRIINNEDEYEEDKINQRRKFKNVNINLNFRSIDNDDDNNDNSDIEQLKQQLDVENLNNLSGIAEIEGNLDSHQLLQYFVVEDYRFVQQIGNGSFGCIYLCLDKNEKKFAIKKIIVKDTEKIDKISSEFELTHQMQHKNILKIYGLNIRKLDSTTQVLYVLMELAQYDWKYEIIKRLKTKNFYQESQLIDILAQTSDALAFLQKNNIAHRDIKPQNILNFNNLYKIADFGCAKEMNLNTLNSLKGTELFISPILFDYLKNNNKSFLKHDVYKSDVYSLGLCILYAATLSLNSITELRKISDQIICYNFLKKSLKNYSQSFINLVYRMLDLNEELRFDFQELKDCLVKK